MEGFSPQLNVNLSSYFKNKNHILMIIYYDLKKYFLQ